MVARSLSQGAMTHGGGGCSEGGGGGKGEQACGWDGVWEPLKGRVLMRRLVFSYTLAQ